MRISGKKNTKGVALSTSGSNIGMLLFWDEENASKYSRLALDTGGWVVTASSIDNNIVRLVFAYNGDKALSCESIFKTDDFGYQEYYIQCANDNAIHYLMVQIGTGERSRDSIELISRVKHGTVYLCGPVVPCKNSADVQ